jgi:DeoR/GlpR family transcriptional regulator of sugar metabolism
MIPHLKDRTNLTIISNSVRLIQCLDCIGHHTIVQLGGALRTDRLDTVGSLAQIGIEQLRGYKAFQGGDGLDIDFGLSAVDHESALIAKIILGNAREVFVLADHTKFDHPSLLYKIVDIEKINCLITDRPLDTAWAQKCRQSDITVAVAKG